jgi:DNA polymerase-1
MQGLLDGDLIAFRCAASAESDPVDIAIIRADRLMRDILEATQVDSYRVFLSGTENFRKQIDPEYKANRKDKKPPIHLQQVREFLVKEWKAEVQDGIEADDALGIHQTEDTIICSLDKDLLQIAGHHYRWAIGTTKWTKEEERLHISEIDGLRNFFISSLVGDRSDNIIGVDGLGPVKSKRLLDGCESFKEMYDICREQYNDDERYHRNLKLLWILRKHDEEFDPDAIQKQV